MKLKMWQVDAFAPKVLEGNPAAIVPLEAWLDAPLMQRIANENNLAETAFFVPVGGAEKYDLRWFTPEGEVDLCGHATLASAWLLFEKLESELKRVDFKTRSGVLTVERGRDGLHTMSMPSDPVSPFEAPGLKAQIGEALGAPRPELTFKSRYITAVWDDAKMVRGLKGPGDIARVLRQHNIWGLIATAPGDAGYDFVSRFFAPDKGVPEDPVTGSAHCMLTPYWAQRLDKTTLKARQVSPRGGDLICTQDGARTILSGPCALYMTAEIYV
ncbi:MAG: PhzF family phenazine biosynthesis protein [Alphaproteobacteria bacterium]|nr:PhzF family phenazine biosynthesis protein [Alphaproteobacteria bacterium]